MSCTLYSTDIIVFYKLFSLQNSNKTCMLDGMNTDSKKGYLHPINHVIQDLVKIFSAIGFEVADSPHIDTAFFNFDVLNMPHDHPARDMQDTFWIDDPLDGKGKTTEKRLIRTQTSNTQVRFATRHEPPFKIIAPGKVFRNEATDSTHEAQFHQIEGMVVGEKVNIGHLKWTIHYMLSQLFGDDVEYRLRPGFFPFVEPGVEVDLKFRGKWLELMGAGMVHPKVLENGGIDAAKYSGFAFGMGIERLAMMRYDIPDIRTFYHGDLRLHHALYE